MTGTTRGGTKISSIGKHSENYLRIALAIVVAFFVLLFLYATMRRLHYGYDFDRMEGAAMVAVWRIVHHLPLYTAPSMTYAPFLYTPGFFYAGAWLSHLFGVDFAALRAVSALSTLGTLALLYRWIFRETQSHVAALAAVGCYVSLYSVLQGWMDMGRVDALCVFLMMLALYATKFWPGWIAGLLWVLVMQTKQSLLPIPILIFPVFFRHPRKMLSGIAVYAGAVAATVMLMQHFTDGWYNFYIFGTVQQLHLLIRQAVFFPAQDVLRIFPLAAIICIASAIFALPSLRSEKTLFYAWVSFLLFCSIWFVRGHEGANVNSLMPLYAWIALVFGLALARLLGVAEALSGSTRQSAVSLVLLAAMAQMLMHLYNPGQWLGSPAMAAGREAFRDQLRRTPGDVWVVNHAWDAMQAGKPEHAEMDALDAVLSRPDGPRNHDAVEDLRTMLATSYFDAIVLDHNAASYERRAGFTSPAFVEHYGLLLSAPGSEAHAFVDVPMYVYLPCSTLQANDNVWPLHDRDINRKNCPE